MIPWIIESSATYIERGDYLNVMDLVQMQGISVQGCGGTIHWDLNHINNTISRPRDGVDVMGRSLMLFADNFLSSKKVVWYNHVEGWRVN